MVKISETICRDDPYDLRRFMKAQKNTYDSALTELKKREETNPLDAAYISTD